MKIKSNIYSDIANISEKGHASIDVRSLGGNINAYTGVSSVISQYTSFTWPQEYRNQTEKKRFSIHFRLLAKGVVNQAIACCRPNDNLLSYAILYRFRLSDSSANFL